MSDAVLVNIDARGVATVTLNRAELHNAFDDALIADLTAKLVGLDADKAVRVVVLAAAGKSYSAGADLNWMKRMSAYSFEENLVDARGLAGLMKTLDRMSKPTIAKVQGAAYGGGVGLVACCDMAIASETASFCLSEVKLGIIPAVISPYVIAAMGERASRRYMLTAERFDALEAHRLGLVHEVVPPGELDAKVEALVGILLANGPDALAACKELIFAVARQPTSEAVIEDTARRIAERRASPEGREGIGAFLEKRKAGWASK